MLKSILAVLCIAAHGVIRGIAIVALVAVWLVSNVGTYVLSVAGISSAVLTSSTTASKALRGPRRVPHRGRR